jgi:hypothetical protein
MKAKIESSLEIVHKGIDVYIAKSATEDEYLACKGIKVRFTGTSRVNNNTTVQPPHGTHIHLVT